MANQLNDIAVIVNNRQISYTGNTLKSRDGFGDYKVRNAVVGGGQTEQVFSKDLTTKFGMVSFEMPNTAENQQLARSWKLNNNANVVQLVGPSGSGYAKVFTGASILNDPESDYSTEGNITIEFNTNPAQ